MTDYHEREKQRTAYHEAGHAVAAQITGLKHEETTMQVHTRGWVTRRYTGTGVSRYTDHDSPSQKAKRARVLVCLAGPLAEARWRHLHEGENLPAVERQVAREQAGGDYTNLRGYLKDAGMWKGGATRQARRFVKKHWRRIEAVAAVLAAKGTADAKTVKRLAR